MIECYYKDCKHHFKDEPYCTKDNCTANTIQIAFFKSKRNEYLKSIGQEPDES